MEPLETITPVNWMVHLQHRAILLPTDQVIIGVTATGENVKSDIGAIAAAVGSASGYFATKLESFAPIGTLSSPDLNAVSSGIAFALGATNRPVGQHGLFIGGQRSNGDGGQLYLVSASEDGFWFRRAFGSNYGSWFQVATRQWVNPSIGALAGEINIGGSSLRLASLNAANYSGDFADLWDSMPAGAFQPFSNTSGSTGFPSASGTGFILKRLQGQQAGAIAFHKTAGSDNKLRVNLGITSAWIGWQTVATEEWANGDFLTGNKTWAGIHTFAAPNSSARAIFKGNSVGPINNYVQFVDSTGAINAGVGYLSASNNFFFQAIYGANGEYRVMIDSALKMQVNASGAVVYGGISTNSGSLIINRTPNPIFGDIYFKVEGTERIALGRDINNNFEIFRYSDTGAYLGRGMTISRLTGGVNFYNKVADDGGAPTLNAQLTNKAYVDSLVYGGSAYNIGAATTIVITNGLRQYTSLSANRTFNVSSTPNGSTIEIEVTNTAASPVTISFTGAAFPSGETGSIPAGGVAVFQITKFAGTGRIRKTLY